MPASAERAEQRRAGAAGGAVGDAAQKPPGPLHVALSRSSSLPDFHQLAHRSRGGSESQRAEAGSASRLQAALRRPSRGLRDDQVRRRGRGSARQGQGLWRQGNEEGALFPQPGGPSAERVNLLQASASAAAAAAAVSSTAAAVAAAAACSLVTPSTLPCWPAPAPGHGEVPGHGGAPRGGARAGRAARGDPAAARALQPAPARLHGHLSGRPDQGCALCSWLCSANGFAPPAMQSAPSSAWRMCLQAHRKIAAAAAAAALPPPRGAPAAALTPQLSACGLPLQGGW